MNDERYKYEGGEGILDGIGHVSGPCEVRVNPFNPQIKRLIANGSLVPVVDVGRAPEVAKKSTEKVEPEAEAEPEVYTESQLHAMNKTELFEIAEALGIDTEQNTLKADLVEMILLNQE